MMLNNDFLQTIKYIELEQDQAKHGLKPSFNEYIDSAIELQNNFKGAADLELAVVYLKKALPLTNKNQYAKSWVYHNLGVLHYTAYLEMPCGVTESLKLSLEYFKQALSYSERRAFLHKVASTLTQIGNVYRRASRDVLFPVSSDKCYELSVQYHLKAMTVLDKGLPQNLANICRSEILLNLSSIYFDDNRDEKACRCLVQSFQYFMKDFEFSRQAYILVNYSLVKSFSIIYSRLEYFYEGQDKNIILGDVLIAAGYLSLNANEIKMMNPLADLSKPEDYILNLYRRAKSSEGAERLTQYLKDGMHKRMSASTDQEADRIACTVQLAASCLARIKSDQRLDLESFSILEHFSALRFTENCMQRWINPSNKFDFHICNIKGALGSAYYFLTHNALALEHNDAESRNVMIDDFVVRINDYSSEGGCFNRFYVNDKKFIADITKACRSSDPINEIKLLANKYYHDIETLNIKALDMSEYSEVSQSHIEAVTKKYSDIVCIKIDIQSSFKNILFVVLHQTSEGLLTKSVELTLPLDLIDRFVDISSNEDIFSMTWDLNFIDWSEILPEGVSRVALLPSFWASFIPWVAVGKHGGRLMDMVDDVVWLPSILSLYHHNISYTERSSHYQLEGKGTAYKRLKMSGASTKYQLLELLTTKDSFSYFGHAEQKDGSKALLKCGDFDIHADELLSAVNGMSLVEVWACQSGKNIPDLFLSSPVNEPFGLDMTMLKFGVDSAIGSLWSVPEFSTLHIKSYYDKQKSLGVIPSKALLSAQKWWVNTGVDEVLTKIELTGLDSYLNSIGGDNNSPPDSLLGPIKNMAEKDAWDLEVLRRKLKHPYAWAAFRFCGLPEHKGIRRESDYYKLDESECLELSSLISDLNLKSGFVEI